MNLSISSLLVCPVSFSRVPYLSKVKAMHLTEFLSFDLSLLFRKLESVVASSVMQDRFEEIMHFTYLYAMALVQSVDPKNAAMHESLSWNAIGLLDLLIIILLCCLTLVIVLTPLVLLYFWVHYSFDYVEGYRRRFSIKKWLTGKSDLRYDSFPRNVWRSYRGIYSRMIGFGLSILAYGLASIVYMRKNFDRMEDALVEYFGYPFRVIEGFEHVESWRNIDFKLRELTREMLLIVVISIFAFVLGYLAGRLVIAYRYNRLKRISGKYYKSRVVFEALSVDQA